MRIWLVFILAGLVAGCEPEIPVSISLEVLVTADGDPVEGMRVTVTAHDTTKAVETPTLETNNSGVVRFEPIHPGTYLLVFEHEEVACAFATVRVSRWETSQHEANCSYFRYAMVVLPGSLEFEQDTVRMPVGDRLILTTRQVTEQEPRTVYARYTSWYPAVFPCADMPPSIPVDQLPCEMVMAGRQGGRPDIPFLLTDSIPVAVARMFPCARGPDGVPLMPDAWVSGGGFSECATWSSALTEAGPGIEVVSASILRAVECGSSWVSKTERDGWKQRWPEPFDGYARLEVEVIC